MGDPVAGPEKQDVEESATHLFRVESSTPSRTDAFAIPIVYTASQLLQGSRYCSAVIHITSIGVATKQAGFTSPLASGRCHHLGRLHIILLSS